MKADADDDDDEHVARRYPTWTELLAAVVIGIVLAKCRNRNKMPWLHVVCESMRALLVGFFDGI